MIKFNHKGKEYIARFTRRTASILEQQGFNIALLDSQRATQTSLLMVGALLKEHGNNITDDLIDELFDAGYLKDDEFIGALLEEYISTFKTLESTDNQDKKKLAWKKM